MRSVRTGIPSGETAFVAQATLGLACFVVLHRIVTQLGSLPPAAYADGAISGDLLARLRPWMVIAGAAAVVFAVRSGALTAPWNALGQGRMLRLLAVVLAAFLSWPLLTLGFNAYFGHGYAFERVVLGLLVLLVAWRPVFLFPYVMLAGGLLFQLTAVPLGGSVLAHKLQVLNALEVVAAAWLAGALTGRARGDVPIFLLSCFVAGAYWTAIVAKLDLGWLSHGELYLAFPAAWSQGWLAFLSPEQVGTIAGSAALLDWPMRAGVLLLEGACLVLLWRRAFAIGVLAGLIVFHLAVFALLGFLFWTWIVLDIVLIAALVTYRPAPGRELHTPLRLALSVLLIAASPWWAEAPRLGWYDTRLNYAFTFEADTVDGQTVLLAPDYFRPYEDAFTMGGFAYLVESHGVLVGPYGVTKDVRVARALQGARDAADVFALESGLGTDSHDPERVRVFETFVRRVVAHRNDAGERWPWSAWLDPPPQFWSFHGERRPGADIATLRVVETTWLFDGARPRPLRRLEVARIDIAAHP